MTSNTTCWMLIRGAASGSKEDRDAFARRYSPVIRAYLGARWRSSLRLADLDDAVQDVFVECFREGGVLEKVDGSRPGGFRAFLYGVVRNVALRAERRAGTLRERQGDPDFDPEAQPGGEETLSRAFDRAWTLAVLREAGRVQEERAAREGAEASRRIDLLRLRFEKDLPIREIARLWETDAARLHKEYARAREEFKAALFEVVSFHHPGSPAEVERECAELLGNLEN